MKRRGRLMMVGATVLVVVSVFVPLLAGSVKMDGFCFDCELTIGQCERDCTAVRTERTHAICDECRHLPKENNCPVGYYCCTACVWRHYNCRKGPNHSIQCSSPPYISKLENFDDDMRSTAPIRCSADDTKCLEN